MGSIDIELATEADDRALRDFLKTSTLPGDIALCLERSPSFFGVAPVMGDFHQVVAVRDRESRSIIAMAERSERRLMVNGRPRTVGYMSGARIRPEWRGSTVLQRGFRFMGRLDHERPMPYYLTTIAADNQDAKSVLSRHRAGLPFYHPIGTLHTLAIPVRRRTGAAPDIVTGSASSTDVDEVVDFLERVGSRRQFFPVVRAQDLTEEGSAGLFRGLTLADLKIARRGPSGRILGHIARWDQRAYKQSVIVGYGGAMRWLKPVHNLFAPLCGLPRMPEVGSSVPSVNASLVAVEADDPGVIHAMIVHMLTEEAGRGTAFLTFALHEDDPLRPVVESFGPFRMQSDLYLVVFGEDRSGLAELDGRIPHVELATL